jgi:peroxiredoxin
MKRTVKTRAQAVSAAICTALLVVFATGVAQAPQKHALVGTRAEDFALKALSGDNVRLSEHLGEVVLLNFWASWCSSCRTEMPRLDKLLDTYRSAGLALYGVNVDDDPVRAAEFVTTVGVDYPVLLDTRKTVAPAYKLAELPMTVLIDRAGVVRYVHNAYSPAIEREYVAELRALLNE